MGVKLIWVDAKYLYVKSIVFSIYVHIFLDGSFERSFGKGDEIVHKLFYSKTGLQNLFNLKGLKLHFNFEIVAVESLIHETYPSLENLR